MFVYYFSKRKIKWRWSGSTSGWTGSQKRAIGLRAIARLNMIRKEDKKKKGKRIGEWIFKDSRYKHTKPQDYKLRLIIDYENFDSFSIKKNVWKVLSFIIFKLHILNDEKINMIIVKVVPQ